MKWWGEGWAEQRLRRTERDLGGGIVDNYLKAFCCKRQKRNKAVAGGRWGRRKSFLFLFLLLIEILAGVYARGDDAEE